MSRKLAEQQLPRAFTYFQDTAPDEAQYGSFWSNSVGTVYVFTPIGWVLVGGGGSISLTSPNATIWFPTIDNDGVLTWTPVP